MMKYIVCGDCGGYYELGEEESLEDFESCHCGGELYYSADGINIDEKESKNLENPGMYQFNGYYGSEDVEVELSPAQKKALLQEKIRKKIQEQKEEGSSINPQNELKDQSFLSLMVGAAVIFIPLIIVFKPLRKILFMEFPYNVIFIGSALFLFTMIHIWKSPNPD